MRQDFVRVQSTQPPPAQLSGVHIYLEVESVQVEARGVAFTVGVENRGTNVVSLLNPFDLLQTQLLDHRGAALTLPQRAPNLLIHAPESEWKLKSALPILGVRHNKRSLHTDDLDAATLIFDASEEIAVTWIIDRLASEGNTDLQQLAGGSYTISCLLTLVYATDPKQSDILRAGPLSVDYRRAEG